jgi:hypothetical protein
VRAVGGQTHTFIRKARRLVLENLTLVKVTTRNSARARSNAPCRLVSPEPAEAETHSQSAVNAPARR